MVDRSKAEIVLNAPPVEGPAQTAGLSRRGNKSQRGKKERHGERTSRATQNGFIIIGFGPVGAMLANLLGLQGISTLVLEREQQSLTCLVRCILTTR